MSAEPPRRCGWPEGPGGKFCAVRPDVAVLIEVSDPSGDANPPSEPFRAMLMLCARHRWPTVSE